MYFDSGILVIEALGWNITMTDLVIGVFLVVMALIGLAQGFIKKFFSLFGTLAVIIASVLLAGTVGGWLTAPFGHLVANPVADWITGLDENSAVHVFTDVYNWADPSVREQLVPLVLTAMGLPSTLSSLIKDAGIFNGMFEGFGETALVEALPSAIARLAMTIVAFVLLFIILTILMALLKRLLNKLIKHSFLGWANRLLGFALGLAHAYLIVSVLLAIIAFFPAESFLASVYHQIDASWLTKFLVEHNWIGNWLINTVF